VRAYRSVSSVFDHLRADCAEFKVLAVSAQWRADCA
jgi:hypothetical protein